MTLYESMPLSISPRLDRHTGAVAVPSIARAVPRPRLRSSPAFVWLLALAALLALTALFAVANAAIGDARTGLQVIGHDSGPQAAATADLYFALSDMDAQVADVLLIGREQTLGIGREQALTRYRQDRARADSAAVQAAELVGADPADRRTVQAVLDALGEYEQLAEQAMLLDGQASHAAGPPPANVLTVYHQATDLMKTELLPKAYNLTLDAGAVVRHTYLAERSAVLAGEVRVVTSGVVLIVVLVALQVFIAVRFRRLVNLPLLLATVGLAILIGMSGSLLATEAAQLDVAKVDGFDSILTLSRARAIGNAATADESRYLLDPGRADIYTQTYLDKSQALLYVSAGSIGQYDTAIVPAVTNYGKGSIGFLGFFGVEARGATRHDALATILDRYVQVQRDDQRMRTLAATGQGTAAIAVRTGDSLRDFDQYDAALESLVGVHQDTFAGAVRTGDRALNGWDVVPLASVLLAAALVVAGVAPRLWEYR
jgi:hypothetical protein